HAISTIQLCVSHVDTWGPRSFEVLLDLACGSETDENPTRRGANESIGVRNVTWTQQAVARLGTVAFRTDLKHIFARNHVPKLVLLMMQVEWRTTSFQAVLFHYEQCILSIATPHFERC